MFNDDGEFLGSALAGRTNRFHEGQAIVALPPGLRGPYAQKVRSLLPKSSPGLIVTIEYPQETQPGPPFSVAEAELRAHQEGSELDLIQEQPWTSRVSADFMGHERCFRLQC